MSYYNTLEEDLARAREILAKGRAVMDEGPLMRDLLHPDIKDIAGGTIYGADLYAAYKLLESFVAEIDRHGTATVKDAFRAGYHCRWHREQGRYCFDPAMSPGDADGAYAAWLASLEQSA